MEYPRKWRSKIDLFWGELLLRVKNSKTHFFGLPHTLKTHFLAFPILSKLLQRAQSACTMRPSPFNDQQCREKCEVSGIFGCLSHASIFQRTNAQSTNAPPHSCPYPRSARDLRLSLSPAGAFSTLIRTWWPGADGSKGNRAEDCSKTEMLVIAGQMVTCSTGFPWRSRPGVC